MSSSKIRLLTSAWILILKFFLFPVFCRTLPTAHSLAHGLCGEYVLFFPPSNSSGSSTTIFLLESSSSRLV